MEQPYSVSVRSPNAPMSATEIDRAARAMWENIAEEYGERRGLSGIVARTYLLARDLQRFAEGSRVRIHVLMQVPRFFAYVLSRSRGVALV